MSSQSSAIQLRVTQEPIPWCTTHDTKGDNDHLMFHRGTKICLISTDGPDHKWWRDTG